MSVTFAVSLDARSRVPQKAALDGQVGVCLARGLTETDTLIDQRGLCFPEFTPLPLEYRLLAGTSFYEDLADFTVKRGEGRVLEHTFVFTRSEPGEVDLYASVVLTEEGYSGPNLAGLRYANRITFE